MTLLTLQMQMFIVFKQEDKVLVKEISRITELPITVIKMLATEQRGEAKICAPESKGEQDQAVTCCWLWELNHPQVRSP